MSSDFMIGSENEGYRQLVSMYNYDLIEFN